MTNQVFYVSQEDRENDVGLRWAGAFKPGFYYPDPQYGRLLIIGPYKTREDAENALNEEEE